MLSRVSRVLKHPQLTFHETVPYEVHAVFQHKWCRGSSHNNANSPFIPSCINAAVVIFSPDSLEEEEKTHPHALTHGEFIWTSPVNATRFTHLGHGRDSPSKKRDACQVSPQRPGTNVSKLLYSRMVNKSLWTCNQDACLLIKYITLCHKNTHVKIQCKKVDYL
jgi:hypothetical protein